MHAQQSLNAHIHAGLTRVDGTCSAAGCPDTGGRQAVACIPKSRHELSAVRRASGATPAGGHCFGVHHAVGGLLVLHVVLLRHAEHCVAPYGSLNTSAGCPASHSAAYGNANTEACRDAQAANSSALDVNMLNNLYAGPAKCWRGWCSGCIIHRSAIANAAVANRNSCGASRLFRCEPPV